MKQEVVQNFVYSNVRVFYAIAKESFNEMKADEKERIRLIFPRKGGHDEAAAG